MTLCPLALAVSCRKCPVFNVCPLKGVIGDHVPETPSGADQNSAQKKGDTSR